MTKKVVTDAILRKVDELQVKRPADLNAVIEQVGRLLESDDVKKSRHLRDAAIRMLLIYGAVGMLTGMILGESNASDDWVPVVGVFLVIMGLPLLFTLYRLGQSQRQTESQEMKLPEVNNHQLGPSQRAHLSSSSVTEHTTQHLSQTAYRPPKSQVTPPTKK